MALHAMERSGLGAAERESVVKHEAVPFGDVPQGEPVAAIDTEHLPPPGTPTVIKAERSSHLRALRRNANARRPVSPPGPPSIGRAAVTNFAGPTLEEVAILASRAVCALKEENGSTRSAIKNYIESFYACDIPDQALTGALRKPAFIEHEPGRFRLRVAAAVPTPPVEVHRDPSPSQNKPPRGARPARPHALHRRGTADQGMDWWRTPIKVTPAAPSVAAADS